MLSHFILALAATAVALPNNAPVARQSRVDTSSIKGKLLCGYQAWFRHPNSGLNTHWSPSGGVPGPGDVWFDAFPDTTGYPSECLFDTGFTLPNGSPAKLYDNTCEGVVDLHFNWLQQFGIDGTINQRFLGSINDATFTTILDQTRTAAEKYGRAFIVEYDITGGNSAQASVAAAVLNDYDNVVGPFTASLSYIHNGGGPVIMVFGIGVVTQTSVQDAIDLIQGLQLRGAYVVCSTPVQWAQDVNANRGYAAAYKTCNAMAPWTVGAYDTSNLDGFYTGTQIPDKQLADSLGQGYVPVVWPGGSNWHLDNEANPSDFDSNPRFNGTYYTRQGDHAVSLDPLFVMTAMCDEVNEATNIWPALKNNQLPTNDRFVGYDNDFDSTSHYLELAGQYAAKLKA
ncbi:hypothetical protein F5884DRAFT_40722 [Xylogone sp. PMI_703]|nr:hypothetical protein F5884DRAFT_40722 [Xylogone sp. PMI_703]